MSTGAVSGSDTTRVFDLDEALAKKLAEPAFRNFAKWPYREVRYLPMIKMGGCGVSAWYVVLPSGKEIILSNDDWEASEPDRAPAQGQTSDDIRIAVASKIVGYIYTDMNADVGPATQARRERGFRVADEIIALLQSRSPAECAPVTPEEIARAIASDGVGRQWDDLNEVDAHDICQVDLIDYANAILSKFKVTKPAAHTADEDPRG